MSSLYNKKWLAVMFLALSYPTSIFMIWYVAHFVVQAEILTRAIAYSLASILTVSMLSLIVLKSYKSDKTK